MSAVRARSLATQVYEEAARLVGGQEFAAGAAVGIADFARRFRVSATPVREAFARLTAEGRLDFVDNVGYSVPALPTAKAYTDWAVARLVVETNALLYATGPLDARLLDEADTLNERIAGTDFGATQTGIRRYSELNWRFHACLIALARNPLLDEIHQRLYQAPQFGRIFHGRGIPNQAKVVAEHARVLRQLRRGDHAEAARALRLHIVDSLERDARMSDVALSLRRLGPQQPARRSAPRRRSNTR